MAGLNTEVIGGISVTIRADYSRMLADLSAAQAIAAAAAGKIASAFNGVAPTAGIVDQFGRSISTASKAVESAVAPLGALRNASGQFVAAQKEAAAAVDQSSTAIALQGTVLRKSLTDIQAVGGAIRVFEGGSSIRVLERFLTQLPGLAEAAKAIFPIVGAIAFIELLDRVGNAAAKLYNEWTDIGIATTAAKKAAEDYQGAVKGVVEELSHIETARFSQQYGKPEGQAFEAGKINAEVSKKQVEVDALNRLYAQAKADLAKANARFDEVAKSGGDISSVGNQAGIAAANVDQLRARVSKLTDELTVLKARSAELSQSSLFGQHGESETNKKSDSSVGLATIQANEQKNQEIQKADEEAVNLATQHERAIAQIQIDGIRSEEARTVAANAADIKMAEDRERQLLAIAIQANANAKASTRAALPLQQTGADANERAKLQTEADAKIFAADQALAQRGIELSNAVQAAKIKGYQDEANIKRKIDEGILESFSRIGEATEKQNEKLIAGARKWGEEQTRASEIAAKGAGETASESFQLKKVAIEQQYASEVTHTLSQELAYMKQIADLDEKSRLAKIGALVTERAIAEAAGEIVRTAQIQEQIDRAKAQDAAAQGAGRVAQTRTATQGSVGGQIGASVQQAAGALSNAVAKGVFEGGRGIGKDITQSLKGVGQQLFGNLLNRAIEQMVVAMTGNTIATGVNSAITGAHTGVLAAHLGVMLAHLGVTIANTIATVANTIATIAEAVASFIGGFFADGGPPPVGVPSVVGERGPEIFVPKQSGMIIPNHMLKGYANGAGLGGMTLGGNNSSSLHIGEMHLHGVQSPKALAAAIPAYVKSRSSSHSPFSK
jgi:hypothetical protein